MTQTPTPHQSLAGTLSGILVTASVTLRPQKMVMSTSKSWRLYPQALVQPGVLICAQIAHHFLEITMEGSYWSSKYTYPSPKSTTVNSHVSDLTSSALSPQRSPTHGLPQTLKRPILYEHGQAENSNPGTASTSRSIRRPCNALSGGVSRKRLKLAFNRCKFLSRTV